MRDSIDHVDRRQVAFSFMAGSAEPVLRYVCPKCDKPRSQWVRGVESQCGLCRAEYQRDRYRTSPTDAHRRRASAEAHRQAATAQWRARQFAAIHTGAGGKCCAP